jgi:DNA-binding transcriptional LysR family regulator
MNDWIEWAEFRHFRYLLTIAERKGFRAAARHLRTSEANLSIQAKQFQEMFEIRLFRRSKDGRIELTATGQALKPIAQWLLDARKEAITALIAIDRGQDQTFSLGCSPFVDPELLHLVCKMHKELHPRCPIRPTHSDTVQLLEELVSGELDAAILTLPISDSGLQVEAIRRDRLVACLRRDHPLAGKATLLPADLQDNLTVLYHPQQHPSAHAWLLQLLAEAGIQINKFSRASHPTELQSLVRAGYGLALIREGTVLEAELTTRPISGVDWVVDTAFVYNKQLHPKTVPVLARQLKGRFADLLIQGGGPPSNGSPTPKIGGAKRPPGTEGKNNQDSSGRRLA